MPMPADMHHYYCAANDYDKSHVMMVYEREQSHIMYISNTINRNELKMKCIYDVITCEMRRRRALMKEYIDIINEVKQLIPIHRIEYHILFRDMQHLHNHYMAKLKQKIYKVKAINDKYNMLITCEYARMRTRCNKIYFDERKKHKKNTRDILYKINIPLDLHNLIIAFLVFV
jgi:hypothetical protein